MSTPVGTRVVAVSHGEDKTIYIFGRGQYVGDEIPEGAGGFMGEAAREIGLKNPKIVLDNGDVVWGCECWWGGESAFDERYKGFTVVPVSIADSRAAAAAPPNAPSEEPK